MTRSPSPISRIVCTAAARSPPSPASAGVRVAMWAATGRGLAIGAEAVVEAPAEDAVAQLEHFRRFERIGDSGEETLVGRHLQGQGAAGPAIPAALHHGASALHRFTVDAQPQPCRPRLPLLPAPWTVPRTVGRQSTLERGG
jgi:hypothetical protein